MATIVLERVTKIYPGGHAAVRDVDLEIADGELLALVGPSGCGKSTLLRLIAGLERPTSGRIRIDSRDVTAVDPQSRDLAMVFQSYALYPHMTVFENLAYGLRVRGADRTRSARRSRPRRKRWASARCSIGAPHSCREDSGNASRWGARWCGSQRRFCSTSHSRTSTRIFEARHELNCFGSVGV